MVMQRRGPSREIRPLRALRYLEELRRQLEDVLDWPFVSTMRRLPFVEMEWIPVIDALKKDDRFVIKADLPGMKKEDIDISVTGDVLTIKGERKAETEVKEEDYYCRERSYGRFSRWIALPLNVDTQNIEANYEDGILEISLPKTAETKARRISVSTEKRKAGK